MYTSGNQLSEHPFLSGIPQSWVAGMSRHTRLVRLHAGRQLLPHQLAADRFWLLHSGLLLIEKATDCGTAVAVDVVHAGDALNGAWLSTPSGTCYGAVAVESSLVFEVDAEGVLRLTTNRPLAQELTSRFDAALQLRLSLAVIRIRHMS